MTLFNRSLGFHHHFFQIILREFWPIDYCLEIFLAFLLMNLIQDICILIHHIHQFSLYLSVFFHFLLVPLGAYISTNIRVSVLLLFIKDQPPWEGEALFLYKAFGYFFTFESWNLFRISRYRSHPCQISLLSSLERFLWISGWVLWFSGAILSPNSLFPCPTPLNWFLGSIWCLEVWGPLLHPLSLDKEDVLRSLPGVKQLESFFSWPGPGAGLKHPL